MSVEAKLNKSGPRKLLAVDAGGMRGLIGLEVLAEVERLLQEMEGHNDKFVLADYFDYIAGTSTGAIVASCLALGMRVSKVKEFFLSQGPRIFSKSPIFQRFKYLYDAGPLADQLKEVFGADTTLGSERLKTLLLLVLTNATTWTPWAFTNDPRAKYNQVDRLDCNLTLLLWQLVRASTASPVYFPPEVITIGQQSSVFMDGSISVYHNPAFLLYLTATLESQTPKWKAGENDILLISVGSGNGVIPPRPEGAVSAFSNIVTFPGALMGAASEEQDLLCRVFGECRAGDSLDGRLEQIIEGHKSKTNKFFTYVRYQADLSATGLLELGLSSIDPGVVSQFDSVAHTSELQLIGKAVAKTKIKPEHFSGFLEHEGRMSSRRADLEVQQNLNIKIDQGQEYVGNELWKWAVWLDGPEHDLDQIDHVTYTLHPTFPNPIRESVDRESKFRLEAMGWGGFPLKATIVRKDGLKEQMVHNLILKYPDGTVTTR